MLKGNSGGTNERKGEATCLVSLVSLVFKCIIIIIIINNIIITDRREDSKGGGGDCAVRIEDK